MSSSTSLYSRLKDTDKQRLAAAFVNVRDQKLFMASVDWEKASLDVTGGNTSGVSFKTGITRMKRKYSDLSPSDKSRMAASFAAIRTPADRLQVMGNVDWNKAAKDFKPLGKQPTGQSFGTGIQRLLKDDDSAGVVTGTTGKKRKPTAANPSPSASGSTQGRKKKSKVSQTADAEEEDATLSTSAENRDVSEEAVPQPSASSKASSPFRLVNTEDTDNATYDGDAQSEEETQFFSE